MPLLATAIGSYGITRALKEGRVGSERLALDLVEIAPITKAMRRMVRRPDLDISEMAFATYLCAKALGKPITALPIFLTRNFHHWAAFRHRRADIRSSRELEGRRVIVNRGYTVTTGLWIRSILKTEHGVDLGRITWMPTDEEHVAEYQAPANVDYAWRGRDAAELLLSGAADAAIGDVKTNSLDVEPLIVKTREAGFAYYRRTGIYPINHAVVVRDDVLRADPTLAAELMRMFAASKAPYLAELASGSSNMPADVAAREVSGVVGDPFPFGITANRNAIDAILDFALDQQIIRRRLDVEEIFAAGALSDVA